MRKFVFLVGLVFIPLISTSAEITPEISVAFSPGKANEEILSAISSSKKSLDVAAYAFTSTSISLALVDAHKRGVKVRLVADSAANKGKYTAVTFAANHGISSRLNGRYSIHHNKFIIIDDEMVQTGSFNYSSGAATRNAENVLIVKDKSVAAEYKKEFDRLWRESNDVKKNH